MDKEIVFEQQVQWGTGLTPEMIQGTGALYAPLVVTPDESLVIRNINYGPDPRHRLDIFNSAAVDKAPVILFVHGGSFVAGDKGEKGSPYYNNIGAWAIEHGYIGVNMCYRLAPQYTWPAGRDDVVAAVEWLSHNIANYGGDPQKIFIMGQSAGGVHVADMVAEPGKASDKIAGALMISAVYDVELADRNDFQKAYYGVDDSEWAEFSSLKKLVKTGIPCFFCVCEHDAPDFLRQARWLVDAWMDERGDWPAMHWLRGHNHVSSIMQISCGFDTLGPLLADFIEAT